MKILRGFRNQCPTCSEYFNSNGAFDKHRVGKPGSLNRRCLTTSGMISKGMCLNNAGFWITTVKNQYALERIRNDATTLN